MSLETGQVSRKTSHEAIGVAGYETAQTKVGRACEGDGVRQKMFRPRYLTDYRADAERKADMEAERIVAACSRSFGTDSKQGIENPKAL
jgi:hypothetical protein